MLNAYPLFCARATGARRDFPGGSDGDVESVDATLRHLLAPVAQVQVRDRRTRHAGIPKRKK